MGNDQITMTFLDYPLDIIVPATIGTLGSQYLRLHWNIEQLR
jgi:hypothetical protein